MRYLAVAEVASKAAFVCKARTVPRFVLVLRPESMAPDTRAPVMLDLGGEEGEHIDGEVFDVDDSTLEALDGLEGVKTGVYYRTSIKVRSSHGCGDEEMVCGTYLFPPNETLLSLPRMSTYGPQEHALYRPLAPAADAVLVRLCEQPRAHGLCTTAPCPMLVHCLRLLPGQDLLEELRSFCRDRGLGAVVVLSCVGSTGKTTLRPAGVPTPRVLEGKFEIVSLTGTLSSTGHHLHMSVSDADCQAFGGHVLEGCIVRTTAEIALGILGGIRFTRPMDPRTGYDELCIGERPLPAAAVDAEHRGLKRPAPA